MGARSSHLGTYIFFFTYTQQPFTAPFLSAYSLQDAFRGWKKKSRLMVKSIFIAPLCSGAPMDDCAQKGPGAFINYVDRVGIIPHCVLVFSCTLEKYFGQVQNAILLVHTGTNTQFRSTKKIFVKQSKKFEEKKILVNVVYGSPLEESTRRGVKWSL